MTQGASEACLSQPEPGDVLGDGGQLLPLLGHGPLVIWGGGLF
jgi:hypothetical protein